MIVPGIEPRGFARFPSVSETCPCGGFPREGSFFEALID